jgi:hypothetical protein
MTRQQMFNTAYHGLAAQGFQRSVDGNNGCRYRGDKGLRCAIGYLISDEIAAKLEGFAVCSNAPGVVECLKAAGIAPADVGFLRELQEAHDIPPSFYDPLVQVDISPAAVKANVENVARKYNLTIPSLPISAEAIAAKEIEHAQSEWRDFAPAE